MERKAGSVRHQGGSASSISLSHFHSTNAHAHPPPWTLALAQSLSRELHRFSNGLAPHKPSSHFTTLRMN